MHHKIILTEPYRDRAIESSGIWEHEEWKFKVYRITHPSNEPATSEIMETAKSIALGIVTKNAPSFDHHHCGYIIVHKGMDSNLVAINFWAEANMIVRFVFVSSLDDPGNFKDVTSLGYSACVWDELVIDFERNAWVNYILKRPEDPDWGNYFDSFYNG